MSCIATLAAPFCAPYIPLERWFAALQITNQSGRGCHNGFASRDIALNIIKGSKTWPK